MNKKEITCCFTGHRFIPKCDEKTLENRLDGIMEELIGKGFAVFCSGGALGFDALAAKAVIRLKEKYPHIKLVMLLPCKEQDNLWSEHDRREYSRILGMADKISYAEESYARGCMHKRNRQLVDSSGLCVAYLKKAAGGTAYTVNYALKNGVSVINLALTGV